MKVDYFGENTALNNYFSQAMAYVGTLKRTNMRRTLHKSSLATSMKVHYLCNYSSSFQEVPAIGSKAGGRSLAYITLVIK